ncbi:MAG: TonB-dependent receptor [Melioribacteraceae bacterium]|nr:TonB-dependent receptor [Melioribacteraceae bacterium]MCF8266190.1 TonB-dependent receptor [Melioribacteraceae bacterium]MCF8431881.1 TonB-dependent receptor [Melioribacteraceae bacterium]
MNDLDYRHFIIFLILFSTATTIKAQSDNIKELMDLSLSDLLNVEIVTASKKLQKLGDVPATVKVISKEKIIQNGYLTLEDVLSDLQGFQFRNIQGFNSYIFQRGIPNQNNLTLVLIDGIQINELNSGGFYGGAQYNLENVERIEVVYGPASALYGTNAISGIINIITKNPKDYPGANASIEYGAFNTVNANASYRYFDEEDNFGFGISGMFKTTEKADLGGKEGDNNWTENMENFEDDLAVDAKILYEEFTFGLTFQSKKASRTTNYKSTGTLYLDHGSSWNINFLTGFLKHDYSIDERLKLTSNIYCIDATVLDNTIGYVTTTSQAGYYRPNNLIGIEEILSWEINNQLSFIGGLEYESETLATGFSQTYSSSATTAPAVPPEPEKQNNSLFSFYLQSQFKFYTNFNLFAGFRFDNSSVYDQVFTPRAGLVYKDEKLGAKFLYASAFRAPKPWDYNSGLGNLNLESEKMSSFEFSLSYSLSKNSYAEISFYKNSLHEKLSQVNTNNGWYWDNVGETNVDGVELFAEHASDKLKIYGNYTYNYAVFDDNTIVPEIAKHSANFGVRYNFTDQFSIGFRNNYLGRRENPVYIESTGDKQVGPAFVSHLNFAFINVAGFNFRLFVNNLFDTEFYHTSNRPPQRYRQPQRMVLFKIEYNLFSNNF